MTDGVPMPIGRCNRCNRPMLIRYSGQQYGPICVQKMFENQDDPTDTQVV